MTDKKDPKKSPWGAGKKTKKATGSTSAPKKKTTSNQDNVPDMEEVLKKAQEHLSHQRKLPHPIKHEILSRKRHKTDKN